MKDTPHPKMTSGDAEFAREAVLAREVITLTIPEDAIQIVFQDASGTAMPFWSNRSRAEEIRKSRPEFEHYKLREVFLSNFVPWLTELEADRTRIGLNWSPETFGVLYERCHDVTSNLMRTYSVQAAILKEDLEREIDAQRLPRTERLGFLSG